MSELEKIRLWEENLTQTEEEFLETSLFEGDLRKRRKDGTLIYEDWYGTSGWRQWRTEQLDRQKWQCASCGRRMKFSAITYFANGDFELDLDYPTVEHILPKSYFPELSLNKQNLVMTCWACNRRKGNKMDEASCLRHQQLVQRFKQSLQNQGPGSI